MANTCIYIALTKKENTKHLFEIHS